jgi:DNA-binding NtrC family response regulator
LKRTKQIRADVALPTQNRECERFGKEAAMGYRCVMPGGKAGDREFRLVEVIMVRKSSGVEHESRQVVIVHDHQDTLRYVKGNWRDFVDNLLKIKKMEERDTKKEEESADIFGNRLHPLFSRISESVNKDLLTNLAKSLNKALIIMAVERYAGDRDTICTVLGIDREKLDSEMNLCGLEQERKAARGPGSRDQ